MQRLERFHVIMYSKSCSAATVNQARQQLFSHGLRSLEAIPPSQAALFEHLRGQSFRHVSFGGRLQHVTRWSLTSAHGDGSSMRDNNSGCHVGQLWLMRVRHILFFVIVAAKRHVVDTVSAAKQECDARPNASVKEIVSIMTISD